MTVDVKLERWDGCYDQNWKGLIRDEAFAHPAKMARGLVARIFEELFAIGALQKGDLVVDPFGGIGSTGIEGASRGVSVVCCELEPKFVDLARNNFAWHAASWAAMGCPQPMIVQGDSRRLREVLGLAGVGCCAVVSSPPYEEIASGAGGLNTKPAKEGQQGGRSPDSPSQKADQYYGDTPGQLSGLPKGDVDTIVASPPYSDGCTRQGRDQHPNRLEGATLGEMPTGNVDAIVSSPPFTQGYAGGGGINVKGYGPDGADKVGGRTYQGTGAERTDGNLETMRYDTVDGVIGSPPWGDRDGSESGVRASKFANPQDILRAGRGKGASDEARLRQAARDEQKVYPVDTPGQLAHLPMADAVVSSTPYASSDQNYAEGRKRVDWEKGARHGMKNDNISGPDGQYPDTEGNLAHLNEGDVDAVVTSPPYEGSLATSHDGIDWEKAKKQSAGDGGEHQAPGASAEASLPANPRNIGNTTGETFWTAAHQIVRECYAILKPGGVAVWVVKAFVRDKQLVDFPGDWRKLCEHVGFETVQEVHASLVHEEIRSDLFAEGGTITKRRERKSFFRRLAEKKGSPRIDYEVVWFMRKPEASA